MLTAPKRPANPDQPKVSKTDDGEKWSKNPNGRGYGLEDREGNIWVPKGKGRRAHAGPHWDVQRPDGTYIYVYPGGRLR